MKRCVVGQGREILLVPGNDLCAEFYFGLADRLAEHGFRSTLLTLPGFHGQPALTEPGWDALIERLAAELDRLERPVLAGHSLGGLAALLLAARRPIDHLVLMEPAIPPGKLLAAASSRRYLRQVTDADRSAFTNWSGSFFRIADERTFPRSMIDLYLEVRGTSDLATARALIGGIPDLYPLPFDRVRCPSLLLYGERSGWASRVGLLYLERKLPSLEARSIDGAAHWMVNEQDRAIAGAIAAFTSRPAGAS
jgi:pimeloyl-ACP methyl ester carboxylesterase